VWDMANTWLAEGNGRERARSVSTDTPRNVTPSFDHVVTQ